MQIKSEYLVHGADLLNPEALSATKNKKGGRGGEGGVGGPVAHVVKRLGAVRRLEGRWCNTGIGRIGIFGLDNVAREGLVNLREIPFIEIWSYIGRKTRPGCLFRDILVNESLEGCFYETPTLDLHRPPSLYIVGSGRFSCRWDEWIGL
jgi:hypothetical protein